MTDGGGEPDDRVDPRSGGDERATDGGDPTGDDGRGTGAGDPPIDRDDPADAVAWPVELTGVTESVTTTLGPNGRWNAAALGLHADLVGTPDPGDPVRARTWGRTRTRGNFERRGGGYVQFVDDPDLFVAAALGVHETETPVLSGAAAWVRVTAERLDAGSENGTEWVDWRLWPREATVRRETVPAVDRGPAAVVEATVAASRLGVDAFDEDRLRARLAYFDDVARTCGGEAEAAAMDRLADLTDWSPPEDETF